jgi:5-(carboxyamino)imidazole ribonucleotide mutase
MPPGIPVATMAINGAKNAGILAAKMMGAYDAEVQKNVLAFTNTMEATVLAKAEKLEEIGYKAYLESK